MNLPNDSGDTFEWQDWETFSGASARHAKEKRLKQARVLKIIQTLSSQDLASMFTALQHALDVCPDAVHLWVQAKRDQQYAVVLPESFSRA